MTVNSKPKGFWTKENVIKEAATHTNMTEFRKHACGAVDAVSIHGWMNEVYEAIGVTRPIKRVIVGNLIQKMKLEPFIRSIGL